MTPTPGDAAERRTEPCDRCLEHTLETAQGLFADVTAFLESEIRELRALEIEAHDEARIKSVKALIQLAQQALLKVVEIETKLGLGAEERGRQLLDLESAREEIDRRLARLAP